MLAIVVDTSALFDDLLLEAAYARAPYLQRSARRELQLVLPEVVVLETVTKFRERATKLLGSATSKDR